MLKAQHGVETHVHIMLRTLELVLIRHRKWHNKWKWSDLTQKALGPTFCTSQSKKQNPSNCLIEMIMIISFPGSTCSPASNFGTTREKQVWYQPNINRVFFQLARSFSLSTTLIQVMLKYFHFLSLNPLHFSDFTWLSTEQKMVVAKFFAISSEQIAFVTSNRG